MKTKKAFIAKLLLGLIFTALALMVATACATSSYGPKPPKKKPLPTTWKKPAPGYFKNRSMRTPS